MRTTTTAGAAGAPETENTISYSGAPPNVSGVRAAVRRPKDEEAGGALASALAGVTTGKLTEPAAAEGPALASFAAALPELLEPGTLRHLVYGSSGEGAGGLEDLVLVSPGRVYVAQRLPDDRARALVSVAKRGASIGWILSEARATLTRR